MIAGTGLSRLVLFLLLLVALYEIVRGLRLWRDPSLLEPDSSLYRWVYWRFFSCRRSPVNPLKLTDRQIRCYGMFVAVVGVTMFAVGLIGILRP